MKSKTVREPIATWWKIALNDSLNETTEESRCKF